MSTPLSNHDTYPAESYARALLDRLDRDPAQVTTLVHLGILLADSLDQPETGLEYLSLALEIDPHDLRALYWSAYIMTHWMEDFNAAEALLQYALKFQPNNAECNDLLAAVLEERKAPVNEVETCLVKAVADQPDWVFPRYGLAIFRLQQGRFDEAETEALQAYRSIGVRLGALGDPIAQIHEQTVTGRDAPEIREKLQLLLREIRRERVQHSLHNFYHWSS